MLFLRKDELLPVFCWCRCIEQELFSLREALSEVIATSPVLEDFAQVWRRIGLNASQSQVRRETMGVHLCNLLKEILQEEEELEKSMISSLQANEAELADLCNKLGLPEEKVLRACLL